MKELTFKTARQLAGLTQQKACKALKISMATLSNIENYRNVPSVKIYINMCKLYNVEPKNFEWHL